MSRCLPFPPPGYVWNGVSGEALLELIKVQRERVKTEREKKKEKRRRKKEEKKEREPGESWKKKQGHHRRHKRLRSNEGEERSESQDKSEYETQEMATSSLTEELEQPISDSLYESSDNSQSIQRKRNSRSCNECHNHGSLLQTDFLPQKHKTPEALFSKPDCSTRMMDYLVQKKLELPVEEEFSSASRMPSIVGQEFVPAPLKEMCHSSQRARLNVDKKSKMTVKKLELPVEQEFSSASRMPATDGQEFAPPPLKVLCHSSSLGAWFDANEKSEMAPTSRCSEISLLQIESQYKDLVENWLPPSLQFDHFDIGDQEWLFETKQPRSDIRGTYTASYDVLHRGNFTEYPHAQHLAQVNIYALPYTILY
ncbi:hypothetical protein REPUB_Repub04eG0039200 [Reevesia pubescens]